MHSQITLQVSLQSNDFNLLLVHKGRSKLKGRLHADKTNIKMAVGILTKQIHVLGTATY